MHTPIRTYFVGASDTEPSYIRVRLGSDDVVPVGRSQTTRHMPFDYSADDPHLSAAAAAAGVPPEALRRTGETVTGFIYNDK